MRFRGFALTFAPIVVSLSLFPSSRSLRAAEAELGEYIPAGVHFFGRWRATEDARRLDKPFADAVRKLVDSGIGKDIFELATIELDRETREHAAAVVKRVFELLSTPDWGKLAEDEMAFAFRLSMPIPEYIVLFRVSEETAEARLGELRKLLRGFAEFAPEILSVADAERSGARLSRLGAEGFPIGVTVAARNDVVAISISNLLFEEVLGLMSAGDGAGSIAADPRFAAAREGLADTDASGVAYFDLGGYIGFFRGMLAMAGGAAQGDPNAAAALSILGTVLDELARMKTLAAVERVQENRRVVESKVVLAQEDGPGFIEKLIREQRPIEDFGRAVPRDALSFYQTSGFSPARVYDAIVGLIRDRLPDGEKLLARWGRIQEKIGVDLKEDLLSWIDGGFGMVTLPSRSGGCPEQVAYLRVKDDEKARSLVRGVLGKIEKYVESRGHSMDFTELSDLENFRKVRIATLPWCEPVIGLPGGVLVVATSVDAVERVAATFRGEASDIRENPRFTALDVPDAPLTDVYYADVEGSLEGFANVMGTIGFCLSLLPQDRDTRPVIKLGLILGKLAAFLRDVDLRVDYSGYTLYDAEKHELRGRRVVTFKVHREF